MPRGMYKYVVLIVNSKRFVTGIGENKIAHWEAGKEALRFSREYARDLAQGLTYNGNTALVVEIPKYIYQVKNAPQKESEDNG